MEGERWFGAAMALMAFILISPMVQFGFIALGVDPDVKSKTGRVVCGVLAVACLGGVVTCFLLMR